MWLVKHYNEIKIHTKYQAKDFQATPWQSKIWMSLLNSIPQLEIKCDIN